MKRVIAFVTVALALVVVARSLVGQDAALARARALLAKVPLIDGHNDLPWTLATRADDVDHARQQGKIASFLGMENGRAIENSLGSPLAHGRSIRSGTSLPL